MKYFRHIAITLSIFFMLLSGCVPVRPEYKQLELRGVWVQGGAVKTREGSDRVIQRAQEGGFKQIFIGVFGNGTAIYPSQVTLQKDKIEPDFDPLAYLVQEAHARNIEVHAWFDVARLGDSDDSFVLEKHPDWGLVGPDGQTMPWLNFTIPGARQFVSDVMMEAAMRGVDGIHFDYARYPGSEWGFDDYSIKLFNQYHDFDLNEIRYADLPAYSQYEANALILPSTAQVLASFSNGFPAIMLNQYGDGQVLILNWQAGQRETALGSQVLTRGIDNFLQAGNDVYILRSETSIEKYGEQTITSVAGWLEDLGWEAIEVLPQDLNGIQPGAVLVLPYVYLFTEADAASLAQFVNRGGNAIFIDSPTPSIDLKDLRAVTGMRQPHMYFKDWLLITAKSDNSLVPVSDRSTDIALYKARNEEWVKFRMEGINAMIEEVYKRIKTEYPEVQVTMTIASDQEKAASRYLQDWQSWLGGGYIDALIPRAYEDTPDQVKKVLNAWSSDMSNYGRMTFGVIVFTEQNDEKIPKTPAQLITEIEAVIEAGSNGFMVFDLDRMTDEQLKALAAIE